MNENVKSLVKKLKIHHYVVFAAILAMGIFNAVTIYSPIIQQGQREDRIAESFNKWWEEEGAPQFMAVGLKADEKTRAEEFEQFRDRYLQQNHTYIIEDRIAEMRQEFRKWWEIGGGKEEYAKDHKVYPNERIFEQECYKWIKKYTDKHARYAMAFVPKDAEYERLLTSWILTPGMLNYAIFAIFFLFAYMQLSRRWGVAVTLGCFAGAVLVGGVGVVLFTSTSFFDHFVGDRYMGASIALAFMLGATSFGLTKDAVPGTVRAVAIIGAVIDLIANALGYGGIYGAVALTSIATFALGAVAGLKIPNRKISHEERKANALEERIRKTASNNPIAMRKAKTRALIKDGLQEANEARYEKAQQEQGRIVQVGSTHDGGHAPLVLRIALRAKLFLQDGEDIFNSIHSLLLPELSLLDEFLLFGRHEILDVHDFFAGKILGGSLRLGGLRLDHFELVLHAFGTLLHVGLVLDFLLQIEHCVKERFRARGATTDIHVHRDDVVDTRNRAVAVVETARTSTSAHGNHPTRLSHLFVDALENRSLLVGNRTRDKQHVGLARSKTHVL